MATSIDFSGQLTAHDGTFRLDTLLVGLPFMTLPLSSHQDRLERTRYSIPCPPISSLVVLYHCSPLALFHGTDLEMASSWFDPQAIQGRFRSTLAAAAKTAKTLAYTFADTEEGKQVVSTIRKGWSNAEASLPPSVRNSIHSIHNHPSFVTQEFSYNPASRPDCVGRLTKEVLTRFGLDTKRSTKCPEMISRPREEVVSEFSYRCPRCPDTSLSQLRKINKAQARNEELSLDELRERCGHDTEYCASPLCQQSERCKWRCPTHTCMTCQTYWEGSTRAVEELDEDEDEDEDGWLTQEARAVNDTVDDDGEEEVRIPAGGIEGTVKVSQENGDMAVSLMLGQIAPSRTAGTQRVARPTEEEEEEILRFLLVLENCKSSRSDSRRTTEVRIPGRIVEEIEGDE